MPVAAILGALLALFLAADDVAHVQHHVLLAAAPVAALASRAHPRARLLAAEPPSPAAQADDGSSKAPGAVGEGRATAGKEHKVARDVKDPGALGFMVLVRGISVWWFGFFLVYTAYTGTT